MSSLFRCTRWETRKGAPPLQEILPDGYSLVNPFYPFVQALPVFSQNKAIRNRFTLGFSNLSSYFHLFISPELHPAVQLLICLPVIIIDPVPVYSP